MTSRSSVRERRADLVQSLHSSTKRDYLARVTEFDKSESAEVAKRFGAEYWDGERRYGYGGYRYDGRWRPLAEALVQRYGLRPRDRVLDVGCGKGYLLYELTQAVPGISIAGLDISQYAVANAKDEVRPFLTHGTADHLPYEDGSFDFVVSLAVLHNLALPEVWKALGELDRVGKGTSQYVMVESFRSEREKANLLYWQLTCQSFYSVRDWEWLFERAGYRGDYGFIFFE